jgi:hypothetical protein
MKDVHKQELGKQTVREVRMTNIKVHETVGKSNTIAIIISLASADEKYDHDAMDTLRECAEQTAQFIQDFTPYYAEVDMGVQLSDEE